MGSIKRKRSADKTPLRGAIDRCRQTIKAGPCNEAHHARGMLEILLRVKELRDALREDMRRYWVGRANVPEYPTMYHMTKGIVAELDDLRLGDATKEAQ